MAGRRLLAAAGGVAAQVFIVAPADENNAVQQAIQKAVNSGQFASDLNAQGLSVSQVRLRPAGAHAAGAARATRPLFVALPPIIASLRPVFVALPPSIARLRPVFIALPPIHGAFATSVPCSSAQHRAFATSVLVGSRHVD
jgi:hypothetical protein